MDLVFGILFKTLDVFTLVSGILGLIVSFLLLFALDHFKQVNAFFNQSMDVDRLVHKLNKQVSTEAFIYAHSFGFGLGILLGSLFFTLFLFFNFELNRFLETLSIPIRTVPFARMILLALALFGKIAGLNGMWIGFALTCFPKQLRKIESRLNRWVTASGAEHSPLDFSKDTDALFFLHPLFFGGVGFVMSALLTFLSLVRLLH